MARKKRDDGRVQVQIDIGINEDGSRKRKYFYGKSLAEARMRRDAWLEEQEQRKKFFKPDITMEEWGSMWLESVDGTTEAVTHRSKKYAVAQQNRFEYDGVALGSIAVKDLMPIHIQAYMRSLAGMSSGTIKQRRCVIKGMLSSAIANSIIDRSPWQGIKVPKGTYSGHRALESDEQKLVLDTWKEHRCGLWALTLMLTGVRREELAALDVRDVDLKNKQIHVHAAIAMADGGAAKSTKSEAGERVVPIFSQLYEPLRNHIGTRKNGLLFSAVGGQTLTATSFRQAWRSYMIALERKKNGIEPCGKTAGFRRDVIGKRFEKEGKQYQRIREFTPHDLRYTYATILYDAGVDVKTAAYLLGHADITMTMKIYTKLSARKKLQGLDALAGYMDKEYLAD